MASCRRAGVTSAGGRRAARAASMRRRQCSSWAPNAPSPADSFGMTCRAPDASFTPDLRRLTQLGRLAHVGLAIGALDLGYRHRGDGTRGSDAITIENRRIGCHRTAQPGSTQGHAERLDRMRERIVHCRALEPAMRHAVVTGGVASHAIVIPRGILHQRLECWRITLVSQQITGPLPAEDVVGRRAPGRALIILVAGEKVEEQPGVIE